jgi:nicotianamine synthase
MTQAEKLAVEVRAVLARLEAMPDLQPSPQVDGLFGDVVGLARQSPRAYVARRLIQLLEADGSLARLYRVCAEGETRLEQEWARRLAAHAQPAALLSSFPYIREYKSLVKAEVALLRRVRPQASRVLFVGSGPLPLSAWLMASVHGLQVDMLDMDANAHSCAMGWLKRLAGHEKLRCIHAALNDTADFKGYNAVVLGAMVGADQPAKDEALKQVEQRLIPGQVLLARSTEGLQSLLYPQARFSPSMGLRPVARWRPRGSAVNSVNVAVKI